MSASKLPDQRFRQAMVTWGVFMALFVLINGTIPFMLGYDLRAWTASTTKIVLLSFLISGCVFLNVPLILTKGWTVVRQPSFWLPVLVAVVGIVLWWPVNRFAASLVVPVLIYLHRRFDLSELGFRSFGLKGDILAILLMGMLSFLPALAAGLPQKLAFATAFQAGMLRLFGNPASTVENLFYFGFLTEPMSHKFGRWLTPALIGLMYTLHEMSNPEYWYNHTAFGWIFAAITVSAAVYVWRRSSVVIWLGDGLSRFVTSL